MGSAESLVGAEFDGFQVERLVGQGAMGAVYQALDVSLKRKVAIKVLTQNLNRNRDSVKRFIREAKAVGAIAHPNIAQVYRVGTFNDLHYYAMEFIDGKSLEELISENQRISGAKAFDLMVQAVRGLKAASERGVIHRDIKPANLMVTHDGTLKVVDFGIAKKMDETETFQTATGVIMGTPAYMAPEMCKGQRVDIRADMYSLGCTFYHMLTGQAPFKGDTVFTVMQQHIGAPIPSITSTATNVPDRLCNIIYTMVEKNPDKRYQSYDQLLLVLEAAREGRATVLTSQVVDMSEEEMAESDRRKLKRLYIAGGIVAAIFILWVLISGPKEPDTKQAQPTETESVSDRPEGGLSKVAETLRELHQVDKELRKDARETY